MKTVALIGTLDTKGPEMGYLRDRCRELGLKTLVIDSGILGEPLGSSRISAALLWRRPPAAISIRSGRPAVAARRFTK